MSTRQRVVAGTVLVLLAVSISMSNHARAQTSEASAGNAGLKISDNGRYFVQDGKPFFWLGDAVWSMFTLYSKEEAEEYMERRRQQGFSVLQFMIPFNGGPLLKTAAVNREGQLPWLNMNPATPNEAFFKTADYMINLARQKGLVVTISPMGGSGGAFVREQNIFTPENVRAYGKWLGQRYKDVPNIVWMNGFDLAPWDRLELTEGLAAGLREGDGGSHLISYGPRGGQSSSYFHHEAWLDFNNIQT